MWAWAQPGRREPLRKKIVLREENNLKASRTKAWGSLSEPPAATFLVTPERGGGDGLPVASVTHMKRGCITTTFIAPERKIYSACSNHPPAGPETRGPKQHKTQKRLNPAGSNACLVPGRPGGSKPILSRQNRVPWYAGTAWNCKLCKGMGSGRGRTEVTSEAGPQAAAAGTGQVAGREERPHSSFLSVGPSTAAWKGQKPQGKGSAGCTPPLHPLGPPPQRPSLLPSPQMTGTR